MKDIIKENLPIVLWVIFIIVISIGLFVLRYYCTENYLKDILGITDPTIKQVLFTMFK